LQKVHILSFFIFLELMKQINVRCYTTINNIAIISFILIAILAAAMVTTMMMYFPLVQNKALAAQETTTGSASMINVTAVVKNGTQSIMKDLNATRQAILSGNTTEAIKKVEEAYQSTGVLNVCATTGTWMYPQSLSK
jgi:hypothetical protein